LQITKLMQRFKNKRHFKIRYLYLIIIVAFIEQMILFYLDIWPYF